MNRKPPQLAKSLLSRLTLPDDPVVGDLDEAYRNGHSIVWYWGEAIAVVAMAPVTYLTMRPMRAFRAVVVGWVVCLAIFQVFELFIAPRLLMTGYADGIWPPFWIAAWVCSYVGFVVSAGIVARVQRREAGPSLLIYVASVQLTMLIAVAIVQFRAPLPTPVPHVLFPLVSIALPYQWRSGFLLAPLTMLIAGMIASRPDRQVTSR